MTPVASLYARLSVRAGAENVSLEGMIDDMKALCAREGFTVGPVHIDDGKTGGRRDRDEFQAWLDDARSGVAQVLIPYHTDRLTREGLNVAAAILDTVEGKDPMTGRQSHRPVRLLDCFGLDSAHGDAFRFRFVIQAEVGRSERERIRERSRDRARRLRKAGRWTGGATPYGYRSVPNPNGEGRALEIHPAEARAIRDAAEAMLCDPPDSLSRVARRMNHAGISPRRGKSWTVTSLRRTLTADITMGRMVYQGKPLRDAEGAVLTPWDPILTVAQVTALRAILGPGARSTPSAPAGGHPSRLLSGLLTCAGCGGRLTVHRRASTSRTTPGPVVIYRCASRSLGSLCPHPVATTAERVEEHVTGLYLSAVGGMPMYEERTTVHGLDELAAVEEEIRDVLADMATAASADSFARLQRAQARQSELAAVDMTRRVELIPTGLTMREHWERSMLDDRRELLAGAFDELTLLPGQRGRKGFDPARLVSRWADGPE